MRTFIISLLILLMVACAGPGFQSADGWKGSNANVLIKRLGQPTLTTTAANGNTLLIYNLPTWPQSPQPARPAIMPAINMSSGKPVLVNAQTITQDTNDMSMAKCTYFFEINSQNIVVKATAQGFNCAYPNNFQ